MRPHPPLLPHFQLPNDMNNSNCLHILPQQSSLAAQNNVLIADQTIPKRFMYKTAKSSEDYGKYWGTDDDLTLLNVIENVFKAKLGQQHSNKTVASTHSKATAVTKKLKLPHQAALLLDSTETSSGLKNIQLLVNELNESQKHNKDLKRIIVNLQNQLESEQKWSQKLEVYIRKHFASSSTIDVLTTQLERNV